MAPHCKVYVQQTLLNDQFGLNPKGFAARNKKEIVMLGSQTQTSPKESSRLSSEKARIKSRYFMTWRWHFYAGLYVIPFMLMLSLTGLVMLFDDEIEQARYQDELVVMPESSKVSVSQQLESVQASYPSGRLLSISLPLKTTWSISSVCVLKMVPRFLPP